MTEREKMLRGELYNARDPELSAQAFKARRLVAALQATAWDDTAGQTALYKELFGAAGENIWVESPFFCDYGNNIFLGDTTFINANCVFLDCAEIHIGKNVLIGPAVQIYAVTHPVNVRERIVADWQPGDARPPYWDYGRPVHIGDNCWLGGGSIILPGVHIGEGTTIGAGSVVTRDIAAHVLACGNPCRVMKNVE